MGIEDASTERVFESVEPQLDALPTLLDKETTLFAYGSLLGVSKLTELVARNRKDVTVHETTSMEEAVRLVGEHPSDLVILRGVRLDGVRASVVSDAQLRKLYAGQGKSVDAAIQKGIWDKEPKPHGLLYARIADDEEQGRFLNGGLIMGLSQDDLVKELDPYEIPPVYTRQHVPKLTIEGRSFKPSHVTFYAGGIGELERTPKEVADAKRYARTTKTELVSGGDKDKKLVIESGYGDAAKWPEDVRSGKKRISQEPTV